VTFTATVSDTASGSGFVPTGRVQFVIDGTNYGVPVSLDANGQASIRDNALSVSSSPHSVITNYHNSDGDYQDSSGSLPGGQTVTAAATSTAVNSSANPSAFGQAVTFTATVTPSAPGGPTPTGTVQFVIDGQNYCDPVALSGGTASITDAALAVGSHTVVALYSGDGNYSPSQGTLTQTVTGTKRTSSIQANFNGTPISAGSDIWFSSVLKVSGLGSSPVTIGFQNAVISFTANGTTYQLSVPNAFITFDPNATSATTCYDPSTNTWFTTLPSTGLSGSQFLDSLVFPVTSALPEGIQNVTWQGDFMTSAPGISVQWQWAAAVYPAAYFSTGYNALGVKPTDDNHHSAYQNADHAGTPENYKTFVLGGATGGGGSNYTGSYSGTAKVQLF
jgi:hypothetical protein